MTNQQIARWIESYYPNEMRKGQIKGLISLATYAAIVIARERFGDGTTLVDCINELSDTLTMILPSCNGAQRQRLAIRWIVYYL